MVRSIGPIGKKAGLCARVPANRPATQALEPVQTPEHSLRLRPWARQGSWRRAWRGPLQQPWEPVQQRRPFLPRQGSPWRSPWICWCRLSLPGLLAIRAGPGCIAARGGWQAFGAFTGARLYRPGLTQTETLQIQHKPGQKAHAPGSAKGHHTRLCSSPCRKMSLGRSMPMKTILLVRCSPSAHCGPRSLPMSWCTPWKITLRSVPFMFNTPL